MNRQQMVAPFAEEELHTFKGRGGQTMTYIEDETVMDRLDLGYGFGNWQVQVDAISENVVKVRLGVRDQGEWVWYEDFGYPNREGGESLKEAVSDGIRRCGRFVGIARDLYRKAPDERRTDSAPERPHGAAEPIIPPNVETEELIGELKPPRTGTVKSGGGAGYKLEARQGPDGHVIGFSLETKDGNIPQVVASGPLGEALYIATGMNPARLVGERVTLKGRLFMVKRPGTRGYYRLHLTGIETNDYILPAPDEPKLPEPPADVRLIGEEEAATAPLFDDVA